MSVRLLSIVFVSMLGGDALASCTALMERNCDYKGLYTCTQKAQDVAACNARERKRAEAEHKHKLAMDERAQAVEKINKANKKVTNMQPSTSGRRERGSPSKLRDQTIREKTVDSSPPQEKQF